MRFRQGGECVGETAPLEGTLGLAFADHLMGKPQKA